MEKKSRLAELDYRCLLWRIVDEVRCSIQSLPERKRFTKGCIRIMMVPLCSEASEWIGGISRYYPAISGQENDICEQEFVFAIVPGGSHTIQYVCDDGHTEPVDCYAYSALKIAYLSWKRKFNAKVADDNIPESLEHHEFQRQRQYRVPGNGYTDDPGAIYTTVSYEGSDFMRIYISVSGAQSGNDDESCAMMGGITMKDFYTEASDAIRGPGDDEPVFKLTPTWVNIQET